jgi:alcohol dehydrogenase class IV
MIAEIQTPQLILIGEGSLARIGEVLQKVGIARPLVVTDRALVSAPVFGELKGALENAGVAFSVFSETVPDPGLDNVEAGAAAFRAGDFDGFIGFGGGSAMDTAKAINLYLHSGGEISRWRVPNTPTMRTLPLVCIPTTAGTGSEVTRGIVVTDPATHEKMVFMGLACLPTAAIVDSALTKALPFRIAADTGLDALTHAIEAYVSKKRSPQTDTMALSAMRLIGPNIVKACAERDDAAREAMMLGSMQAGMAFSNASVALVHGMSRPLGSFFKIPHGMSNAMLLADVTEFSIPAVPDRYATCARTTGLADASDDDQAASRKLVDGLRHLARELKVPSLAEFGVDKAEYDEKIPTMISQALASGSPNNNPRVPSPDEIGAIYRQIWR